MSIMRCDLHGPWNSDNWETCPRCGSELEYLQSRVTDLQTEKEAQFKWVGPSQLQIDSYATGRILSSCHIIKDELKIEITDGAETWRGSLQLPKGFGVR